MRRDISFHPKFAAILDGLFGVVMLWLLARVGAWWLLGIWFILRAGLWGLFTRLVYYPKEISRLRHFLSLVVFSVGITLLLIFIEWNISWIALAITSVILSAGSFWLLPPIESKLPFLPKPHRRWLLFLNLFGVVGILSGVYATAAFQLFYNVSSWVWLVLAALVVTAISAWWWWEYGISYNKRFILWTAVYFLIMLELGWGVLFLPLGFLVSGVLLTWIWYILWLLVRFNLSKEGINWRKQRIFVIINLALIVLYLALVVRWK